ncbi:YraN family protein [Desulfoluna sp.]|uniref:YraN family protein n=1 Tax=Desulfoluna sp. TaxID=2045199 RepID=UPI002637D3EE|nr:YraN family protein [Desulfoluna sp.]
MSRYRMWFGRWGERRAARYLKRRGYRILARNAVTPLGEIDLVAEDKGTLVFVEVKSRTSTLFGRPEDAVTKTKQATLARAALYWLKSHDALGRPARFDVVAILAGQDTFDVQVIENAFPIPIR